MIIADKIIHLRKKNGWSQEELAEKMNVSRQAVSKWESAQAVPDIDKILMLSELFGVTTDYLLKGETEYAEVRAAENDSLRRVSTDEVSEYIETRRNAAYKIAAGVFMCIISPVALILLGGLNEARSFGISENLAGVTGIALLLVFVAVACIMFIQCDMNNTKWKFLDNDGFELERSAEIAVSKAKKEFAPTYTKCNIIGTLICVLSPIPLISGALFEENELMCIIMLCVTIILAGIGVMFFVSSGVQWGALQRLNKEYKKTSGENKEDALKSAVTGTYWLAVTAVYLLISFLTDNWGRTWIIWPVAAVLCGALNSVFDIISAKNNKQ